MVFSSHAGPYRREFREGAAALSRDGWRAIPEIAKELGIAGHVCVTDSSSTS